jgi:CHAT domain-containing protein
LLAAGEREEEDGLLEAREIVDLDLRRVETVVLSACETARGRFGAGEGVIGLSWAFLLAGCPTVVASQWQVDSAATERLMLGFYGALGPGPKLGKARAMRRAALSLLRSRRFSHPYYWSGFIVLGKP